MYKNQLLTLIQKDKERLLALMAVKALNLPQCYIAAGFVRNLVWDSLHGSKTPLNDIDVIFFDLDDLDGQKEKRAQQLLSFRFPSMKWQVKNQAFMHKKHGDKPYTSCIDAMAHWPEKETAVAVALNKENQLVVASAFELDSLFDGCISYNPARDNATFQARIAQKNWLQIWPQLKIVQ